MANTFFGFESDLSAVGAGKLGKFEGIYEPPEEEIDQLNDETFGAGAEDGDWEEQHEKMAGTLVEPDIRTEKALLSPEEQLEQSISQLVVEDDEDFNDPAVINVSKGRTIPRGPQDLDELFGPSSPPAFMDMETLVSPSSRNIWGSPAKESHFTKHVNNIQSLFAYAKAAKTPAFDEPYVVQTSVKPAMTGSLPRAMTLEELEGKILGRPPKVISAEDLERQLRGEGMPARHRSSHEEYHHQPVQEHTTPFSMPVPIPLLHGRTSPADFHQPPQMPAGMSPLSRNSFDGRMSPAQVVPRGRITPPMPGIGSPMMSHTSPFNRGSPMNVLGQSVSSFPYFEYPDSHAPHTLFNTSLSQSTPIQPQHNANFSFGIIEKLGIASIAQALLIEQLNLSTRSVTSNQVMPGMPNGMPRPMAGGRGMPYGSPGGQGPYGSPVAPPRMPFPMPYSDPAHLVRNRGIQQSQQYHQYDRPPHKLVYNNRNRPTNGPALQKEVDEYAGLMTKKEKDWIIKIQLLQLQTEDPYLDDFYYTNYSIKKKAKERLARERQTGGKTGEEDPMLVIPALAKIEAKAYKPVQFEGSLGRLTSSSVHNPRQIIDLKPIMVPSDEPEGQTKCVSKELRKFRQLLMDIEKCYVVLLEIDDIEKRVLALPEDARKPLLDGRKAKINQLYKTMCCPDKKDEILGGLLTVRKGRKLLARIIPLLDQAQDVKLAGAVFRNMLILMKKDVLDDSLPLLFGSLALVISNCDLEALTTLTQDLQTSTKAVSLSLQNKFGSSLIYTLLSQGDTIYSSTSVVELDSDHQNSWTTFVQNVAEAVDSLPSINLTKQAPSATQQQEKIWRHFQLMLSPELLACVEDKMKTLVVRLDS